MEKSALFDTDVYSKENMESCFLFANISRWKERRAAHNNRFGIMAAGRWSNRQHFAIHLLFQQDVIS